MRKINSQLPVRNEELLGMRDYLFDLTHVKAMTCDVESTQRKVPRFFHDFTTVMASLWHGMSDILITISGSPAHGLALEEGAVVHGSRFCAYRDGHHGVVLRC